MGRTASAHYHILLPDKPAADRDSTVNFTLRFGHPFEHQVFACERPTNVVVVAPDGKAADLTTKVHHFEETGADQKPVPAYRWSFTPGQRGDHVLLVRCEPEWLADEKTFLEDTVKVVLHVQTQNGWDAVAGDGMELVPLTRPYGLQPGTVFQVMVRGSAKARPRPEELIILPGSEPQAPTGVLVEIERYNQLPPKQLPSGEHITRAVKTDPNGVATMTLPEPGWWAITAVRDGGTRMREGQRYPVKARSTLWVHVDDKVPPLPPK
jgi:cobalt/nickel transport protein